MGSQLIKSMINRSLHIEGVHITKSLKIGLKDTQLVRSFHKKIMVSTTLNSMNTLRKRLKLVINLTTGKSINIFWFRRRILSGSSTNNLLRHTNHASYSILKHASIVLTFIGKNVTTKQRVLLTNVISYLLVFLKSS